MFLKSNRFTINLIIMFVTLFSLPSCFDSKQPEKETKGVEKNEMSRGSLEEVDRIVMWFPINAMVMPRVTLVVHIPQDFQSYLPLKEIMASKMNEFFPKKDKDIDNWTEIITTFGYVGARVEASAITDDLKKRAMKICTNIRVTAEKNKKLATYSTSEYVMAYTCKGKREVVFVKYYSGPYDCAGFQYAIRLMNGMSEDDAIKKIKEYVKNNLKLV